MKNINLLVWLTQLGLSVCVPLAVFVLIGVWLHQRFGWGNWVIYAGLALGFYCAVDGFRVSLKTLQRMYDSKPEDPPTVSFNDHD